VVPVGVRAARPAAQYLSGAVVRCRVGGWATADRSHCRIRIGKRAPPPTAIFRVPVGKQQEVDVFGSLEAEFDGANGIVSTLTEQCCQSRRPVLIDEELHAVAWSKISRSETASAAKRQCCGDIVGFQRWKLVDDLLDREPARDHVHHRDDWHTKPTEARNATYHLRVPSIRFMSIAILHRDAFVETTSPE